MQNPAGGSTQVMGREYDQVQLPPALLHAVDVPVVFPSFGVPFNDSLAPNSELIANRLIAIMAVVFMLILVLCFLLSRHS